MVCFRHRTLRTPTENKCCFVRLSARLGLSIISVSVTLCLLEGGVRVISPQDMQFWDSSPIRRLQAMPPHYVENIPYGHSNYGGVPVIINSFGLRDNEIEVPKPPHTYRIVGVGDSITFGYGIRLEDTFLKVLEKRLNQGNSAEIRFEVLNAGTVGGGLSDYYHFLSQKAAGLQPDMVLIGVALNDIAVYSDSGSISESGAEWEGQDLPLIKRVSRFILRHSQLYAFSYVTLKSMLYSAGILDMNKVQGSNLLAIAPPSPHQVDAMSSSLRMMSQIVAFCRRSGFQVTFVVFPLQMQLSPAQLQFYRNKFHIHLTDQVLSGEPQRRLREFGAASGTTVVDLLPVFRAGPTQDLYLRNRTISFDPSHLSVLGNQVAGQEIFRVLQQSSMDLGRNFGREKCATGGDTIGNRF